MERKLVLLVFILGVSGVFSFYLNDVNNKPAVYEVKEDPDTHTLTITNPTPEKPVLREIVYYHIIEKPYKQVIKHNISYNSKNRNRHRKNTKNKKTIETNNVTGNENNKDLEVILIKNNNEYDVTVNSNEIEKKYVIGNAETATKNDNVISKIGGQSSSDSTNNSTVENKSRFEENVQDNFQNIEFTQTQSSTYEKTIKINDESIVHDTFNSTIAKENITSIEDFSDVLFGDNTEFKKTDTRDEINFGETHLSGYGNVKKDEIVVYNEVTTDYKQQKAELGDDKIDENLTDHFTSNSGKMLNTDNPFIIVMEDDNILYNKKNINNELNIDNDVLSEVVPEIDNRAKIDEFIINVEDENLNLNNSTENSNNSNIIANDFQNEISDKTDIEVDDIAIPDEFIINVEDENDNLRDIVENSTDINSTINNKNGSKEVINENEMDIDGKGTPDEFIIHVKDDDTTYKNNKTNSVIENDHGNNISNEVTNKNEIEVAGKTDSDEIKINFRGDIGYPNVVTENVINKTMDTSKIEKTYRNKENIEQDKNIISSIIKDDNIIHNDYIIYVDNDYDNPFDGKEGVNFRDRHFTNGHGFQYFHPLPENQISSAESASLEDEANSKENSKEDSTGNLIASNEVEENDLLKSLLIDADEDNYNVNKIAEKEENFKMIEVSAEKENGTLKATRAVSDEDFGKLNNIMDKNRRKRELVTTFAVNEEFAPEDMLKNVMNKVSERVKRNIEKDDTYGMRLTGDIGVVWNNVNDEKVFFPVGGDRSAVSLENQQADETFGLSAEKDIIESIDEIKTPYNDDSNKSNEGDVDENVGEIDKDTSSDTDDNEYSNYDLNNKEDNGEENLQEIDNETSNDTETDDKYFNDNLNNEEDNGEENLQEIDNEIISETETDNEYSNDDLNRENNNAEEDFQETDNDIPKIESNNEYYDNELYSQEHHSTEFGSSEKTYGMSLTNGHGSVWNDLYGYRTLYEIGDSSETSHTNKRSSDDSIIDKKIKAFHDSLKETPSSEFDKTVPVKPKIVNSVVPKQPSTEKTTIKDENIQQPDSEKPKVVQPTADYSKVTEPNTENSETYEVNDLNKTYGISLSGDKGIVWNDLNGQRTSYHVGEQNSPVSKGTKDDEIINEKIDQFYKSLKESSTEQKIEKPESEPKVEEPITEIPKIVPLTEEPVIYYHPVSEDPKTNRPVDVKPIVIGPTNEASDASKSGDEPKTFGMSLEGQTGIVWNDLNGHRISYHVGESNGDPNEDITSNSEDATNPVLNDNDQLEDNTSNTKDETVNETDDSLTELKDDIGGSSNDIYKVDDITDTQDVDNKTDAQKKDDKTDTEKVNDKADTQKADDKADTQNVNNKTDTEKVDNKTDTQKVDDKTDAHKADDETDKQQLDDEIDAQQVDSKIDSEKVDDKTIDAINEALDNKTAEIKNDLKDWIKEEVAKQIEEYFATHDKPDQSNSNNASDENNAVVGTNDEVLDSDTETGVSKKRKDCDEKKDEKESEIKVVATNIYGYSAGNANVTNIFIFNINNGSDIANLKPLNNGTDSIFVFGTEDEKPIKEENNVSNQATQNSKESADTTSNLNGTLTENQEENNANSKELAPKPDFIEELNTITEDSDSLEMSNDISKEKPVMSEEINHISNENLEEPNEVLEELDGIPDEETEITSEETNISEELNGVLEKEPSNSVEKPHDISEELNGVSEESNDIVENPNDISEELNEVSKESNENLEETSYISEESNGVLEDESYDNLEKPNNISEELNGVSGESNDNLEKSNDISEELNGVSEESNDNLEKPNDISGELNEILEEELNDNLEKPIDVSGETNDSSEELDERVLKIDPRINIP